MTSATERLTSLDGLRGLLALYVLLSHMAPFAGLPPWLVDPLSHGEAAVDIFFILSGTVIVRSLQKSGLDRPAFLAARAARTLPAFLVVFALAVPIQPLPTALGWMPWVRPDDPGRAIWSSGWPGHWAAEIGVHLAMAHGLLPDRVLPGAWVSFLGAGWSLSTEWQFYLLVAVLFPRPDENDLRRLVLILMVLAAAGLGWRLLASDGWQFSRAFLPNKAAYFALGVASARALDRRQPAGLALTLAAALAVCGADGNAGKLAAPLVWILCLAAQAGVPTLLAASLGRVLRWAPLLALGRVSYSIYLVNEPVQKLLALALAPLAAGNAAHFALLWVPAAVLLPLGAALLLHRYVEAPCLRRGRSRLPAYALTAG